MSLVRDLTLPGKPTRKPVNGDLLGYVMEMQEQVRLDSARKAELRAQLDRCR